MSAHTVQVIKRSGRRNTEFFQPEKLHASVAAACLSVSSPEGEAEMIAVRVVDAVARWCHVRYAVTSQDICRIATRGLELFHPEAAYMYKNHEVVV